jgi:hypothetical protein
MCAQGSTAVELSNQQQGLQVAAGLTGCLLVRGPLCCSSSTQSAGEPGALVLQVYHARQHRDWSIVSKTEGHRWGLSLLGKPLPRRSWGSNNLRDIDGM